MGKKKRRKQVEAEGDGGAVPYWSPLERPKFTRWQQACIVARNLVPLACLAVFHGSIAQFMRPRSGPRGKQARGRRHQRQQQHGRHGERTHRALEGRRADHGAHCNRPPWSPDLTCINGPYALLAGRGRWGVFSSSSPRRAAQPW